MANSSGAPAPVVYRIDGSDTISFVNDAWALFAAENGAPQLACETVGRSLWSYVAGKEVIHLQKVLVRRVRQEGAPRSFPFRCDSPLLRRLLRLELVPMPGDAVEFRSQIVHEEPWAQPIRLLDPIAPRANGPLLRMCSWCKRIALGERWLEVEAYADEKGLFDSVALPEITHGICDDCSRLLEG